MKGTCTRSDVHYIHRGTYIWRQHTHERTTKQGNILTKETTRRGHHMERTLHGGILYGRDIIQMGYICKGDMYITLLA